MLVCAVMLLTASASVWGQSPVEQAIVLGNRGAWQEAAAVLRPAVNGNHRYDAQAWYILGYALKEQYKQSGDHSIENPERLGALQSFQRSLDLQQRTGDVDPSLIDAMEVMAESFLKDAAARVVQFAPGDDDAILKLLWRYEAEWTQLHPTAQFEDQEFDLYFMLAEANCALLDPDLMLSDEVRGAAFEQAIAHYEAAGLLRPEDDRTHYNLAVTWYNEGVRKIRAIDNQVTLSELMRIQSECVQFFKRALQPMQSAYALNPKKARTLNGLMIIHRALEHREESARFKEELEALKGGQ